MCIEEGMLLQYQGISNRMSDPGVGGNSKPSFGSTSWLQEDVLRPHDFQSLDDDYRQDPRSPNLMSVLPVTA